MRKKRFMMSPAEIQAEREVEQAEYFDKAVELMDTPLGMALRNPGVTFRHWRFSFPFYPWVESECRTHLFESNENDVYCPVIDAFKTLKSFLYPVDSDMGTGGEALVLSPEFIAKADQAKLDTQTASQKKITTTGPRL